MERTDKQKEMIQHIIFDEIDEFKILTTEKPHLPHQAFYIHTGYDKKTAVCNYELFNVHKSRHDNDG